MSQLRNSLFMSTFICEKLNRYLFNKQEKAVNENIQKSIFYFFEIIITLMTVLKTGLNSIKHN